jgi:hypothetical protein
MQSGNVQLYEVVFHMTSVVVQLVATIGMKGNSLGPQSSYAFHHFLVCVCVYFSMAVCLALYYVLL